MIYARERLAASSWIAHRFESDAEVGTPRQRVKNFRRDRIAGQCGEQKCAIVPAGADAAIEPLALMIGSLLQRRGDGVPISCNLRLERVVRRVSGSVEANGPYSVVDGDCHNQQANAGK